VLVIAFKSVFPGAIINAVRFYGFRFWDMQPTVLTGNHVVGFDLLLSILPNGFSRSEKES